MGDLREPNDGGTEERPVASPSSSSSNPSPSSIGAERWARAEQATQKIICQVQPTVVSEERRKEVIDYVQRLIRGRLGCLVFPFGSVPLKTYLPDGDIDLTAFGGANVEDALANGVVSVLEGEDQNRAAEFIVKDVQIIRAEVKLVKCIVQNIVVDISFNQLGGLCTLCFLERVNRLIGNDHLFKRSIILIKAWCYYESRILGAHHSLISTYALETLVLYIFHLFHSTLNGPLAVLYKFLDYFSKFDWDNYCISLTGPVRISSLPEIVAETPENGGSDLLLSNDFIRYCVDMFSVPSRGVDLNSRTFPQKHLNIVDPLKENNNLGRSVSKGNFYRIRSAFTYGARKLGRILLQPDDNIADELRKFFSNTLDRHGSGQRPDVQDLVLMSGHSGFGPALSFSETESCQEEKAISELKSTNSIGLTGERKLDPDQSSHDGDNNIMVSGMEMKLSGTANGHVNGQRRGSMKVVQSTMLSEADGFVNGTAVMGYHVSGDAKDLTASRIQGLKISNGSPKFSSHNGEESISPLGIAHHAPHLYFSGNLLENGKMRYGNTDQKELECSVSAINKVSSGPLQVPDEGTCTIVSHGQDKNQLIGYHEVLNSIGPKDVPSVLTPVACSKENLHPGYREGTSAGNGESLECLNLSDLTGDYDSHLNSLQCGRWCYEYASSLPALPITPPLPSQFQSMNSWDPIRHSSQFKRNGFSHTNVNGVIPRPAFYPMNTLLIPGVAFGVEEIPKPRGTGTYFPNVNRPPYQKPLTSRGRNQAPVRSPRNNGRAVTPVDANLLEKSSRELSQAQFPVDQGGGKPGSSDIYQSGSPGALVLPNVNGLTLQSDGPEEFGLGRQVPIGSPLLESSRQPNPASSLTQSSSQGLPIPGIERLKPVLGMNQDRVTVQSSYHLKDEDDFPPLSV
uniref:Polymerase nucleotidyl transferase domain-containing protein n=1 Tax=Davidia involucrata TaxID=16924 RepID=A0A5B6Z1Q5_DAVIN